MHKTRAFTRGPEVARNRAGSERLLHLVVASAEMNVHQQNFDQQSTRTDSLWWDARREDGTALDDGRQADLCRWVGKPRRLARRANKE